MDSSPVFEAVKRVLALLGQDIPVCSYEKDFEKLWELSGEHINSTGAIVCVVDGCDTSFKWLPIGVWGAYYRVKHGIDSPKFILVGEDVALDPSPYSENIYIPNFYEDGGIEKISLNFNRDEKVNKKAFIVELYEKLKHLEEIQELIETNGNIEKEERELSAKEQMIEGWQGLIRSTFSLPEKRHRVSNEIAPMALRIALEQLHNETTRKKRRIIRDFLSDFSIDDKEKRALMQLWEWVTGIQAPSSKVRRKSSNIEDIWGVWDNASFMLVDDQGESHGYDKILKCALALIKDKKYGEIKLDCFGNLDGIKIENILEKYACIFLDLRLKDEDQKISDYNELDSVKMAIELSRKCPAFPIIIFSSSQQREIDRLFSPYKNIITCFRKPGIAGSLRAIDGGESLKNLFEAIKKALVIFESKIVWDQLEGIRNEEKKMVIEYQAGTAKETINLKIDLSGIKKRLFKKIFFDMHYELAFQFPYTFFEDLIAIDQRSKITFSNLINVNDYVVTKLYDTKQVLGDFHLKDIPIPDKIIRLRILSQFRNMASHGLRDFAATRSEAICVLIFFIETIENIEVSDNISTTNNNFKEVGIEPQNKCFYNPLIRPYYADDDDAKKLIHELFAAMLYYSCCSERTASMIKEVIQ